MMKTASEYLTLMQALLQPAFEAGAGITHRGVCQLRQGLINAKALAKEAEEELLISDMRIAELLHQVKSPRREPVDIDQEGNVIRMPFRPRVIRIVIPGGGDAA